MMEDDWWWKTTYDGRHVILKGVLYIIWKKCWRLLTFTATAKLTLNRKSYHLFKPEIELDVMGETYAYAALHMRTCAEKPTFLGKDD